MLESVAAVGSPIVPWLLTYLLHSTVAIGFAWILVRVGLVRAPSSRDALWKTAVLAGVLSAAVVVARVETPSRDVWIRRAVTAFPVPVGARAGGTPPLQVPSAEAVRIEARLAGLPAACAPVGRRLGSRAERPAGVEAARVTCFSGGVGWQAGLGALWIMGALVALLRGIRARRLMGAGMGPLTGAGERSRRALARLGAVGRGAPELRVSPHADSPCVFAGAVVLPERCERELSDDELEAVLAHEAAHLARRDPLWLAVFNGIGRILWLQPLNRLARSGFLEASELACDDWAVARLERPLDLARSISRVAEWSRPRARVVPATALARSRAGLSERVRRILRGEGRVRRGRFVGLLPAAAVLGAAFWLPAVSPARTFEAVIVRQEGPASAGSRSAVEPRLLRIQVRAVGAR